MPELQRRNQILEDIHEKYKSSHLKDVKLRPNKRPSVERSNSPLKKLKNLSLPSKVELEQAKAKERISLKKKQLHYAQVVKDLYMPNTTQKTGKIFTNTTQRSVKPDKVLTNGKYNFIHLSTQN